MASVYEIINGISQAMVNSYDGALDDKGEPVKIGLKREEGDPLVDSRIMDGFNIKITRNRLALSYQSEMLMEEAHDKDFETDVIRMVADCAKWLKKEYKRITGNTLTLTKDGEPDIVVHATSRVRVWVEATCWYKIGGIKEDGSEKTVDNAIKKWLDQSSDSKPENVTRKKDKFKYFEPWNVSSGQRNK